MAELKVCDTVCSSVTPSSLYTRPTKLWSSMFSSSTRYHAPVVGVNGATATLAKLNLLFFWNRKSFVLAENAKLLAVVFDMSNAKYERCRELPVRTNIDTLEPGTQPVNVSRIHQPVLESRTPLLPANAAELSTLIPVLRATRRQPSQGHASHSKSSTRVLPGLNDKHSNDQYRTNYPHPFTTYSTMLLCGTTIGSVATAACKPNSSVFAS